MRIASMQNYLPEFNTSRNSFDQLRIDLCELIKINGGGWIGRDNANTIEKKNLSQIYQNLYGTLTKTLDDRFKIPEVFTNF